MNESREVGEERRAPVPPSAVDDGSTSGGMVRSPSLLERMMAPHRARKNAQKLSFRVSGRFKMKMPSLHHSGGSIAVRRKKRGSRRGTRSKGRHSRNPSVDRVRSSRSISSGLSRSSGSPFASMKKFRRSKEEFRSFGRGEEEEDMSHMTRSKSMSVFVDDKIGEGLDLLEGDSYNRTMQGASREQRLLQQGGTLLESPEYRNHPFFAPGGSWNSSFTMFVLDRVKFGWVDEMTAEFPDDTARVSIKKEGALAELYLIEMHGVTGYSTATMHNVTRTQALQFLLAFETTFHNNFSVRYDAEAAVVVSNNRTQLSTSSEEDAAVIESPAAGEESLESDEAEDAGDSLEDTSAPTRTLQETLDALHAISSTSTTTSDATTSDETPSRREAV